MFKTLTAGLMALSLTLTSATSVQAQGLSDEDAGKIFFGLLATAAIAHAIKKNREDRQQYAPQAVHRVPDTHRDSPRRNHPQTDVQRYNPKPQGVLRHDGQGGHADRRHDYTVLPRTCMRNFEGRNGSQRMLNRRCLQQNYARAASLPDRCAVRIFTDRGPRNGYDPRCLRDMGYTLSRR